MGGSCLGMSRHISTRFQNHGFVGQPGTGHLQPKPEGLELERHREGVLCSG